MSPLSLFSMLRSKGIVKARPGSRAQGGITLRSEQGELAVVSDVAYFVCSIDMKKPLRTLRVLCGMGWG
jgi:DNA-binding IscR family transcriptional regulator